MLVFREEQLLAEEIEQDLLLVIEKMERFCEDIESDISNKQLSQLKTVYNRAKKINNYMKECIKYNNTPEKIEAEKNSFDYKYRNLTAEQKQKVAIISCCLLNSNVIDEVTARLKKIKVEDLDLFCSLFDITYDASGHGMWRWIEFFKGEERLSRQRLVEIGATFNREDFEKDKKEELEPIIEEKLEQYGYGFVEPSGKFIESDFGTHTEKAYEIIKEKKFNDEYKEAKKKNENYLSPVDFLVYTKKYVLLHNPIMGGLGDTIAQEPNRLTKAQREFLFDYYTREGLTALAKHYLEDE